VCSNTSYLIFSARFTTAEEAEAWETQGEASKKEVPASPTMRLLRLYNIADWASIK
jgi:hypothetical protein